MARAEYSSKPSRYVVRAILVISLGALSLIHCEERPEPDAIPPGEVTDLGVARVTPTSVALRWTAPGDDGASGRAASYDVRYSSGVLDESTWKSASQAEEEPSPSQPGAPDSVVVEGLVPGVSYSFGLKVADEDCNFSELSNVVTASTVPESLWLRIPWVVDGLSGVDADWTNCSWSLSAAWAEAPGAERYEYAIRDVDAGLDLVPFATAGDVLHITHSGLALVHGTTYCFGVRACRGAECGRGVFSDGITVDLVPPESRVRELPPEVDSLSFQVTWSGTDDLSGIAAYSVRYKDGVAGEWKNWLTDTPETAAVFTGKSRHTYCFASSALDRAGNREDYPADSDAQTRIKPIEIPAVAWVNDGQAADADWTNAADRLSANWAAAPDVDGYECAFGTSPSDPENVCGWTQVGTQTSLTKPGLELAHGVTYFASVRVCVDSLRGDPTSSDGVTVDIVAPESRVEDLPDTLEGTYFRVAWAGSDDLSGVASYDVQVRDGVTDFWFNWLRSTTLTSCSFGETEAAHTYFFRSSARDRAGNQEPYSDEPDAQTHVMDHRDPKFALHVAAHRTFSCNPKPVITCREDLVRYWPSIGTDMDAFMVIFHYDSLFVYEYGLDWPEEWGSCYTQICGGMGVNDLQYPGDPGVAIFMDNCKIGKVHPFLVVSSHWFAPTSPGEISIRSNRATDDIGIVNCAPEPYTKYLYADSIFCAGVQVDPYEGPAYCCTSTSAWERLKSLFK
jgi:hypothetical protein